MPLTEIAVRKATPGAKTTRLFDGGGLYLEWPRAAANGGGSSTASPKRKSASLWASIPRSRSSKRA